VSQASGRLWERVAEFIPKGLSSEEFWKLIAVYDGNVIYVRASIVWDSLSIPLTDKDGITQWVRLADLDKLKAYRLGENWSLKTFSGLEIGPNHLFEDWEKQGTDHPSVKFKMQALTLASSSLVVNEEGIAFQLTPPDDQWTIPAAHILTREVTFRSWIIKYMGKVSDSLTAQSVIKTANLSHHLVRLCLDSQYLERRNILQEFAHTFVPCVVDAVCSDKQKELFDKPNRWMKYAGHCFFAVDWSKYHKDLQPPYKIWLEDGSWLNITETDLHRWRDSTIRC
jgi:hypothetical protein